MCDHIALQIIIYPLFGGQFRYYLMVGSKSHDNCINSLYKIRITIIIFNVIVLPGEPVNLAVYICNISVKAHCNK